MAGVNAVSIATSPAGGIRAVESSGNLLTGYSPRTNFADGDVPKLYKLSYFKSSTNALAGFREDEAYVALLERIKDGREDVMKEVIDLYRNGGKRKEVAETYFQLAQLKMNGKDYKEAAALLDNAVKFNPDHAAAKKERDRLKLELTYQSLTPSAEKAPEAAAAPVAATPAAAAPAADTPAAAQ